MLQLNNLWWMLLNQSRDKDDIDKVWWKAAGVVSVERLGPVQKARECEQTLYNSQQPQTHTVRNIPPPTTTD